MAETDGLLVLDKPGGMTSRAAVDRAMRWFGRGVRMGHAGTLDPLATGVLVLCLGGATRLVEYVQRMGKTYRSTFQLGARSDTDDADGVVTPVEGAADPGGPAVQEALGRLVGVIRQTPPAYSAAKVTGRRAYDLARRGDEVRLEPRAVTVYGIDVLAYRYPEVEVEVRCGKGTYVRSLARDLGEALGCGGLVQTLRRTRTGPFTVEGAATLGMDAAAARARLLGPAAAVADLPHVVLAGGERERLRNGQAVALAGGAAPGEGEEVAVLDEAGRLAAVCAVDAARRVLRPAKVFG
jgi:tRNA pseudouridine55 synthase